MDQLQDPQFKTADGSALRVWRDTAQNKFRSERTGKPEFDEVVFVEVISPGSRDSSPVFELVRYFPEDTQLAPMYGAKYEELKHFVAEFEKGESADATMAGTPLSQWSEMTKSMAASLKAQNIFTVDALAALPDTKLNVVGPDGRTWRAKAIAYIENAKGSAVATQLAAELERTKTDLADKDTTIRELSAKLDAMQAQINSGTTAAPAPQVVQPVAQLAPAAQPPIEQTVLAPAAQALAAQPPPAAGGLPGDII